jgi:aryl-alcohol dehydrogenase-like predicted oxidoreductase
MPAAFGLGTAQFGLAYGISNDRGQVPRSEVESILEAAANSGCNILDTAAVYGDSEQVLGDCYSTPRFRVVTKTAQFRTSVIGAEAAATLRATFENSLSRLRLERVHGLLIHYADDLLASGGDRLWREMERLRAEGSVSRIGASLYDGAQLDRLLERFPFGIVQVPLNVLDQRLVRSGRLADLRQRGIEVHVRSPFLQGILLMAPADLPAWFAPIRPLVEGFQAAARSRGLTPLEAAIAFVRNQPDVDVMVMGFTGRDQFADCLTAYRRQVAFDATKFSSDDPRFLNPMNWRTR